MILQLSVFGRFVQASLADDRVDRDRRFAGRAVAEINSRWPRPIGTIASIAMMLGCTGSLTLRRLMIPGAIFSTG